MNENQYSMQIKIADLNHEEYSKLVSYTSKKDSCIWGTNTGGKRFVRSMFSISKIESVTEEPSPGYKAAPRYKGIVINIEKKEKDNQEKIEKAFKGLCKLLEDFL